MTKKEAIQLVGIATANFPNMQEKDMRPTAQLWHRMLEDIPYEVAEKALFYVLSTAKYFPTVAEIREAVVKVSNPDRMTPVEAYEVLRAAMRRHHYYHADRFFAEVPELIGRVVKMIGWEELWMCENPEVLRAQFLRLYEALDKREQERLQVPSQVLQLTDALARKMIVGRKE